ncbi:hypothetical protein [Methylobacterium sp. Leaf88]|uniref:hypothetical protein n=1 Tax=Methylobacterium sp. Leaf88 TaxID=1736244 RepID=UPI0006FA0082|nr:hypothetical protein [Methylobacterium sp. Leaf88]KQO76324.1 hypothetical protein ASF20_13290 [Methylobacterium sp. Leaf88]
MNKRRKIPLDPRQTVIDGWVDLLRSIGRKCVHEVDPLALAGSVCALKASDQRDLRRLALIVLAATTPAQIDIPAQPQP